MTAELILSIQFHNLLSGYFLNLLHVFLKWNKKIDAVYFIRILLREILEILIEQFFIGKAYICTGFCKNTGCLIVDVRYTSAMVAADYVIAYSELPGKQLNTIEEIRNNLLHGKR